jgi:hypothetical protein
VREGIEKKGERDNGREGERGWERERGEVPASYRIANELNSAVRSRVWCGKRAS